MKNFLITWTEKVAMIVEAESKEEALKLFNSGEYDLSESDVYSVNDIKIEDY